MSLTSVVLGSSEQRNIKGEEGVKGEERRREKRGRVKGEGGRRGWADKQI